ncbi:MAG: hypothetical protein R3F62_30610 [Planctomycetota bacterium]
MTRRAPLVLLALLVACASDPEPQPGVRQGGTEAPPVAQDSANLAIHWDALATRLPSFERSVHVASAFTQRTEIGVVRVIDNLKLPFVSASSVPAEFGVDLPSVVVVVSGTGEVALLSGEAWKLEPGDVLLLPPEAQGFVTCTDPRRTGFESGLRLLTLRVADPDATFAPQRIAYQELWAASELTATEREQGLLDKEALVGRLGDAASLHVYRAEPGAVRGGRQTRREKLLFFLLGRGRFGMANTGNMVQAGSLFAVAPGALYFFENKEDPKDPDTQGNLALVLYTPGWTKATDDTELPSQSELDEAAAADTAEDRQGG